MLTLPWVTAFILLFALNPVAKLVRRFIYALVEQYDRGDPAGDAEHGMAYGKGSLAAAASVAKSGFSAIRGGVKGSNNTTSPPGGGGGNPPSGAGKNVNAHISRRGIVGGKVAGSAGDGTVASTDTSGNPSTVQTGGYLPEKQRVQKGERSLPSLSSQGNSLEDSNREALRKQLGLNPSAFTGTTEGRDSSRGQAGSVLPGMSSGASEGKGGEQKPLRHVDQGRGVLRGDSSVLPGAGQPSKGKSQIVTGQGKGSSTKSTNPAGAKGAATPTRTPLPRRSTRQPPISQRAARWGNIGRKTMAVAGGVAATAVGMGVAAAVNQQMGTAIATRGTQMFTRAGERLGRSAGTAFHGGRHFAKEFRHIRKAHGENISNSASTAFKNTVNTIRDERKQARETRILPINTSENERNDIPPPSFDYTSAYHQEAPVDTSDSD